MEGEVSFTVMEAAPETRGHHVLRWVRPPWSAAAFCALVPLVAGLALAAIVAVNEWIDSVEASEAVSKFAPEGFGTGGSWSHASEGFFGVLGPFAVLSIVTYLVSAILERRIE